MPETPSRAQLTTLLSNDVLDRLERLRINAGRRFTSKSQGEHLSGKGGRSIEFSDYRDYSPGDDFRFVDWNIFARLQRAYLKLYHQEEEIHVVLMVDASSSMLFEGKLDRATQLAAAFGVMGLLGSERVSVFAFNAAGGMLRRLPPCVGRASMRKLFAFLERLEGGGDAPVEDGIERALRYHAGRGVAVVLSDFLTFGDVKKALNRIFNAGLETCGIQVLCPAEIDPDLSGDVRLVDCETQDALDVSAAGDLLDLYAQYRLDYEARLSTLCQQRAGRFACVGSEDAIEWILFDLLRRRGWVR